MGRFILIRIHSRNSTLSGTEKSAFATGQTVIKFLFGFLLVCHLLSCSKEIDIESSTPASEYDSAFLSGYYDLFCSMLKKTPGYFPPQAARAYGYMGIAQHEAIVHGIGSHYSLSGQLNQLEKYMISKPIDGFEYHWAIASNAASAQMFRRLFEKRMMAEDRASIDQYEESIHAQLSQQTNVSVSERSRAGQDNR